MTDRRWAIFGLGATAHVLSMFFRASSAVIAPELQADLGLDNEQLGLLGAAFFYIFALIQLPVGIVLDRVGPRLTMVALNLFGVAGAVVFAQAHGLTGGLVGRLMLGVGMSANFMGTLMLLTRWFPPGRFATMIGLTLGLSTLGSVLATSPLVLLVRLTGWRGSFMLLALVNFLLAVALVLWVRDHPPGAKVERSAASPSPPSRPALKDLKTLLLSRDYWAISWATFVRYGTYASIQSLWIGPFLMLGLGISPLLAGQFMLLLTVGAILGAPSGGMISDRLLGSRKRTVQVGLSFMSAALLGIILRPDGAPLIWLAVLLFGFGFANTFGNVLYAHIKELMPPSMSATAMSGINFFTMMGGGVFLHVLGRVLEGQARGGTVGSGPYKSAFLICFGAQLLALAVYSFAKDAPRLGRKKLKADINGQKPT